MPFPSRFRSPSATSLRKAPSTELTLREGQSSRISCLVKRPIFFKEACLTISNAGSLVSTRVNGLQNLYMQKESFLTDIL